MTIALSVLPQMAAADEVRRAAFANALFGTWALTADLCESKDKSNIVISETKYIMSDDNCDVRWVVETPGRNGVFYAAHASCVGASKQDTKVADIIIQPESDDRLSIGRSFDNLKTYRRCRAKQ